MTTMDSPIKTIFKKHYKDISKKRDMKVASWKHYKLICYINYRPLYNSPNCELCSSPLAMSNPKKASDHTTDYHKAYDMCRGIIIEEKEDDIIIHALPFSKFFEREELIDDPDKNINIIKCEKLDGSFIGLFRDGSELRAFSMKSFDNPLTTSAMTLLKKR